MLGRPMKSQNTETLRQRLRLARRSRWWCPRWQNEWLIYIQVPELHKGPTITVKEVDEAHTCTLPATIKNPPSPSFFKSATSSLLLLHMLLLHLLSLYNTNLKGLSLL